MAKPLAKREPQIDIVPLERQLDKIPLGFDSTQMLCEWDELTEREGSRIAKWLGEDDILRRQDQPPFFVLILIW